MMILKHQNRTTARLVLSTSDSNMSAAFQQTTPRELLILYFFPRPFSRLMKDPVMDPEGNSFERHEIEEWYVLQI